MQDFFSRRSLTQKGFTLLEILIVIGIIGIMTSVIVAQYRKFDSSTLLTNLAFEVALAVRETQVLTISTANNDVEPQDSYGIYFDRSANSFTIFADNGDANMKGDDVFDGGTVDLGDVDVVIKTIAIPQGAVISRISSLPGMENRDLGTATFDRPHLDTVLILSDEDGRNMVAGNDLYIEIASRRDTSKIRTVHISKSGMIEVITP